MYLVRMPAARFQPLPLLFFSLLASPSCAPRGAVRSAVSPAENPDILVTMRDTTGERRLPPVPQVRGPLAIKVVYPAANDVVDARDSSFLFGSVGTGDATLTVNGTPVPVWPNGAWLAWLPFPPDSVARFDLVAHAGSDSASLVYPVRRSAKFVPPALPVWIDSASVSPQGRVWWPAQEYLPVTVRAANGATVRIRLADGRLIPLVSDPRPEELPWGVRAFDRDTLNLQVPTRADRYAGVIRGLALGSDPGPLLGPAPVDAPGPRCPSCPAHRMVTPRGADSIAPVIEAIIGGDTARARWPVQLGILDTLPVTAVLDDDTAGTGLTDRLSVGRAKPGGTYYWFFPTGTRVTLGARIGDDLRVQLSRGSEAWIPAADAHPLPAGAPPVRATVGSTSLTAQADRLIFRLPMSQPVPFLVSEDGNELSLRLYGAVGDVNWIRYGGTDPLVKHISWAQTAADEVVFHFTLSAPVWGYRTRWDRNDLLLEIRRPPAIRVARPLGGLLVVVDPGHPPLGATGPTGYREAEANLGVALVLEALLERAGARVVMTRTADSSVDLLPRVKLADSVNADLLISIHNNALPDGVNPFTNNGTSVYYNHPRSLPLAVDIQRALVRRLGLRDLGVGRGDLALVRPTWMPAVLCEGLFMMLPDQESALRSPEGQRRYARAVLEGTEEFLRGRAEGVR